MSKRRKSLTNKQIAELLEDDDSTSRSDSSECSDESIGDKNFEPDGGASDITTSSECESDVANDEVSSEDEVTVSDKMAWQDSEHSGISDWVDIEDAIEEFLFEPRPGIIADVPNNATPLNLFSLLFLDKILDHVVDRTNRYAERLLEAPNVLRKSKVKKWVALSRDELKRLLAVSLLWGQVKMPTSRHYFCRKGLHVVPAFSKIMSGRRYEMILKHLHIDSDKNDDPLSKLRPVIDLFIGNIYSCYYPDQNPSLDESMMAWRGRLRFCQYMKGKNTSLASSSMSFVKLLASF